MPKRYLSFEIDFQGSKFSCIFPALKFSGLFTNRGNLYSVFLTELVLTVSASPVQSTISMIFDGPAPWTSFPSGVSGGAGTFRLQNVS